MLSHARRMYESATLSQAILIACLGVGIGGTLFNSPAIAQTTQAQPSAAQRAEYNIPAGNLDQVLNGFAAATGVHLAIDASLTSNLSSPGLQGRYTVEAGLAEILSGTGLLARRQADGSYTLQKLGTEGVITLDPVLVSAEAKESIGTAGQAYIVSDASVGVLGNKTLKDTPYSIEAYSRGLIENLQARSLADLSKGDAAVSLMTGNLVTENNSLAIRGLSIDSGTGEKLDGTNIRLRASDLHLEHVERVEILKGASSFLYGFGSPGGIVNYILKRPTDEKMLSLSTQVTDDGLFLVHGDAGGRIGNDDRFGYRVNLIHESGDTYINDGESDRRSGSIAMDWRIAPGLTWQVDGLDAKHTREGGYWALIPNATGDVDWTIAEPLDPIDGDKRLAPKFSSYTSIHKTVGTNLSWWFNEAWNVSLAYRYSDNGREYALPILFADTSGRYSARLLSYSNRFKSEDSQLQLQGAFATGPVRHQITAGLTYNRTRDFFSDGDSFQRGNIGSGNLSSPQEFSNPFFHVSYEDADTEFNRVTRREVFFSDTLKIGDDLDVILGIRRGNLVNHDLGGGDDDYDESANTPTVAVVYRPVPWLSTYASYIEALEEGEVAPASAVNAFEVFEPLTSEQHEIGMKAEGDNWSASAALFRLQRGLSYTTAANVFTQNGEVRYEGLEVNGKFRFSPQWLLNASAIWLDATNRETGDSELDGKDVQGVARQQASLYAEYSLPNLPLTITAGTRYVGERPLDYLNRWDVGSVTLFDLGARFETEVGGKALTLRLNIDNLTDEAYWVTTAETGYLNQGEPRIIKLGAKIDF